MDSNSAKRHTQIDLKTLGGLGRHPQTRLRDRPVEEQDMPSDRITPERDAVKVLVKKRARSPDGNAADPVTGLKHLRLPEAVESGIRAHEYMRTKHVIPWRSYEKIYELRLGIGNWVTVAERRDPQSNAVVVRSERKDPLANLVTVRIFPGPGVEDKFRMLQRIQHANFVSALEIFRFEGSSYVTFEHMPVSLYYIAGNPRVDELRLAAILGQILNGLAYLATKGLEHGSLTCSNILVNSAGDVKIADQECCCFRPLENAEPRDIRALSVITMQLMQGDIKDDRAIGVHDLRRWPSDSDAVGFLSETTSATSVDKLIKHPLLQLPWQKEQLQGLVDFTRIWARIGYRYPPSD